MPPEVLYTFGYSITTQASFVVKLPGPYITARHQLIFRESILLCFLWPAKEKTKGNLLLTQ